MKCLIDGCDRPEEMANGRSCGGLCAGHRYRKKKGLPLESVLDENKAHTMLPWELVFRAAIDLADAESDNDFRLARERLRKAALRYALSSRGTRRRKMSLAGQS